MSELKQQTSVKIKGAFNGGVIHILNGILGLILLPITTCTHPLAASDQSYQSMFRQKCNAFLSSYRVGVNKLVNEMSIGIV